MRTGSLDEAYAAGYLSTVIKKSPHFADSVEVTPGIELGGKHSGTIWIRLRNEDAPGLYRLTVEKMEE